MESDPTIEALLAQAGFLRALARRLTTDEAEEDDLVQDTWARALRAPRVPRDELRPWLRRVLRNVVTDRRRADRRRRHREAEATRGAAIQVESETILRDVLEAVLELAEPYRGAILMRYYEGLPPREIARRREIPVVTVQSHLHRAVAQLRERLDRTTQGGRAQWCATLAAATGRSGSEMIVMAQSVKGIGVMGMKVFAGCLVVLIGLALGVLRWSGDGLSDETGTAPRSVAAPPAPRDAVRRTAAAPPASASLDAPGAGEPFSGTGEPRRVSATPSRLTFVGRVLTPDGTPFDGATVGIENRAEQATTRGDGTYRLELAAAEPMFVYLIARAPGWMPSLLAFAGGDPGEEIAVELRLDRSGSLVGRVVAPDGATVGDAIIEFGPRFSVHTVRREGQWWRYDRPRSTTSTADGRFEIAALREGLVDLRVRARGFPMRSQGVQILAGTRSETEIRLDSGAVLSGLVLDADDRPVAGAQIVAHDDMIDFKETAVSDEDGRFHLDAVQVGTTLVRATHERGERRVLVTLAADHPTDVVIRLEDRPDLVGLVRDGSGSPLVGLEVAIRGEARLPENDSGLAGDRVTRTDEAGRFLVARVPRGPLEVQVRTPDGGPSLAVRRGVRPTIDPLVIEIDRDPSAAASLFGTLARDESPLADLDLAAVQAASGWQLEFRTGADGRFDSGPLPAGAWRLESRDTGLVFEVLAEVMLGPGERRDLGRIVIEPRGRLVASWRAAELPPRDQLHVSLWRVTTTELCQVAYGEPIFAPLALPPGSYCLTIVRRTFGLGDHPLVVAQDLEIVAGVDALVDVPDRALVHHRLEVAAGPSAKLLFASLVLRDPQGRLLPDVSSFPMRGAGPEPVDLRLPTGRYAARVFTPDGRRGEAILDVRPGAPATTLDVEP